MKISSVALMDTFLKVHLKKPRNVILGASTVSNKFEASPWRNRAALAANRIQFPVPAPLRGLGLLCQIITQTKQSSCAAEGCSMNQPTSEGAGCLTQGSRNLLPREGRAPEFSLAPELAQN